MYKDCYSNKGAIYAKGLLECDKFIYLFIWLFIYLFTYFLFIYWFTFFIWKLQQMPHGGDCLSLHVQMPRGKTCKNKAESNNRSQVNVFLYDL